MAGRSADRPAGPAAGVTANAAGLAGRSDGRTADPPGRRSAGSDILMGSRLVTDIGAAVDFGVFFDKLCDDLAIIGKAKPSPVGETKGPRRAPPGTAERRGWTIRRRTGVCIAWTS